MWKRILVFLLCLLISQAPGFFVKPAFAAQIYDMASSSSYNLRYDGATAGDALTRLHAIVTGDLDNDGKKDLLIGARTADYNSRTDSGSFYIIYGSLLESHSGAGNNLDLADSNNWNIRFDGGAGDNLSSSGLVLADFNNDGKLDILVASSLADNNNRTNSGSIYLIFNSVFAGLSGTGRTLDLANPVNYNLRFDASTYNNAYTGSYLNFADFDNDGKKDIIFTAATADYNSRTNSGSLYVIYNTLIDDYSGTGNNIDLATTSNWNLRFDGATAGENLSDMDNAVGDLDNDGEDDLIIGALNADRGGQTDSGAIYVIYNTIIRNYSGTSRTIDLATSSNYNLQFYGAANETLGMPSFSTVDLDNNGRNDLLIGANKADYNGRTDSGSAYVIYDSLLDDYSGTGNLIDLTVSTNYNLRFDGATASDYLSSHSLDAQDIDNDGKKDILVSAPYASFNSRTYSGSLYIIFNSLIDDYSGTGNNIDLANSSNYSLRYDGSAANEIFAYQDAIITSDLNNDGKLDLIVGAAWADKNSRTNSGSLYVIYNFPHAFSLDSVQEYDRNARPKITGSILAPNSVLNPYNVQFQVDASAFYGTWTACPADDGTYSTKDVAEKFTCQLTTALTEGAHKVYIRASDANTSFTAQHKVAFLNTDLTGPSVSLTQIDGREVQVNQVNQVDQVNPQSTFFGKITDSLSQSLASGPKEVKVELKKKDSQGNYQTQETKTISLTENYWSADGAKITDNTKNTSNKYSLFSYTPSAKLSVGSYQLTVTGVDKADNQGSPQTYQFTVGGEGGTAVSETAFAPAESEEAPLNQPQSISLPEPKISAQPISFFQKILNFLKNFWPF